MRGCVLLMVAGLLAGCQGPSPEEAAFPSVRRPATDRGGASMGPSAKSTPRTPVAPRAAVSDAPLGRVVSVHGNLRFVVIDFGLGEMPPVGTRWGVYRGGLKVGEVKITGPQQETNIVGDITSGDARTEDEVRSD